MVLSDVSIKRPVFTVIVMALLLLFGAIGYERLGVDLMPKIDAPYVSIQVVYRGADPEVVESRVLKPIEDSVSTISGVKKVTSSAVESFGMVVIEFELSVPVDRAAQDVREKVAKIQRDLPTDADAPVIEKIEIGAAPVVALVLTGPAGDPIWKITYQAEEKVKPQIQRFEGVGVVDIIGKQTREVHITADPEHLRTYGLTLPDLQQAIGVGNLDVPGGHITTRGQELLLKTHGEATNLDDLRNLVVSSFGGSPVRLADVATVEDSAEEARTVAAYDSKTALTLLVRKQSDANSVAVSERVMKAIDKGELDLPEGYKIEVVQNSASYTRQAISSVIDDLILGAILAVFVILLFLRDGRATFISALALPTSVIATFAFMQAMHFTMNNLTMLALSISIGMLIDDAIVVIENIFRHLEMGKSPWAASKDGTSEIGLAVLATTLSVVAVFVPVALMEGLAGRFFFEFGLTVAFAMAVSLFVSFTLTPMASSRLLTHHAPGKLAKKIGNWLELLDRTYRRGIEWTLSHRWRTIGLALAFFAASIFLMFRIPSEFQGAYDQGELDVAYSLPEGGSLEAAFERGQKLAELARANIKELQHTLITVGGGTNRKVNEGVVFLKLTGSKHRKRNQDLIAADFRQVIAKAFPGEDIAVNRAATAGTGNAAWSRPLNIQLRGDDSRQLRETAEKLVGMLKKEKGFVDLTVSDRGVRPQTGVALEREKVANAGLVPAQVAMAVRTAVNGTEVSQYRQGSDRYKVILQAPDRYRHEENAVFSMPLRGMTGNLVEVGELARPVTEDAPSQIDREDRVRTVTILGNLEGIVLGQAQNKVLEISKADGVVPKGVTLRFGGQGQIMKETFTNMARALILAIILIYMVLAAQFESFLHPITIMMSLPMSLIGAVGGLLVAHQTLNIMSFIGIIMLMGLVTKNAILLVDNANQRREQGMGVKEALAAAGATRLRPILMTTGAMIFGMLPVALALGEGSEVRAPMGVAVIGGLVTSTLLTLFVVPVFYSLLEGGKAQLARIFGHPSALTPAVAGHHPARTGGSGAVPTGPEMPVEDEEKPKSRAEMR